MESLLNSTVIWAVVGFLFFLLEFLVPGFILFFFGIGAWIVAGITFFADVSITVQLAIFLGASLLTVLLFRNWVKNKLGMDKGSGELLEDEFIGKIAKAETAIRPGMNGKVTFKGASWDAYSDDTITEGENVTITGNRSILLIVKSNR